MLLNMPTIGRNLGRENQGDCGGLLNKSIYTIVEAAAATADLLQREGVEINEVILDLDRPFVFMIYESDTHTPLFVGQVFDPTAHN